MNPSQVIDIGDHDYCVVLTQTQTLWLNANWDTFKREGRLDWAFKELVKTVRNGHIAIKILNALSVWDYLKVRVHLSQAAAWNPSLCFVYAIDGVGKVPVIGRRWRGSKLRPVKDENHVDILGIIPNRYVWVEQRDKEQKYIKVYGYK